MQRRDIFVLFAGAAISGADVLCASPPRGQEKSALAHIAWVAEVLKGVTRKALLVVFTTEGGLSTGLQRTFVSRDCPYFKVDVEFQAVGRPSRDDDGRATLLEEDNDIVLKISTPYLQFSHAD